MALPVLDVRNLSVSYTAAGGHIRVVNDASFHIGQGETLALAGETGCGKSTLALALLGMIRKEAGRIFFEGRDLSTLNEREWEKVRGRKIGMIFQDARSSMNPVLTVGHHLAETLRAHQRLSRKEARARSVTLLSEVGIPEPDFCLNRYPLELSGGMCQRVGIALGICNGPRLLVADEPTSALDPTIQAQILELLKAMKQRLGLALLLISHDLALLSECADRIAVMYHGRIMECGPAGDVLSHPAHPYTRALVECLPERLQMSGVGPLRVIPGSPPAAGTPFPGCVFAPRCRFSEAACNGSPPPPVSVSESHWAACIKAGSGPLERHTTG